MSFSIGEKWGIDAEKQPTCKSAAAKIEVLMLNILEMVRAAGIEPAPQAWEAHVLPIYYARIQKIVIIAFVGSAEQGNYSAFGLPSAS